MVALAIYALVVTIALVVVCRLHFWSNPLPWPDRGHRVFGVKNEEARHLLVHILAAYALKENFTFDMGPSHQTIMMDGTTVIHHFDERARGEEPYRLTGTALSIRASNPREAALEIQKKINGAGFKTVLVEDMIPGLPHGQFYMIRSDAFVGWDGLVITLPIIKMKKPRRR